MKRLFALVLLLGMCAGTRASEMVADPAYGVKYDAQELVVELPQDQARLYLTLLGDPQDARFNTMLAWFESNPRLKAVRDQTHFNVVKTNSVMWFGRYAATTAATPCVRLQTADGSVVFEVAGDGIPMSAEALTRALSTECLRRRYVYVQPQPRPNPDPAPQPLTPAPPPYRPAAPLGLLFLLFLLGAAGVGVGIAEQWKKTHPRM